MPQHSIYVQSIETDDMGLDRMGLSQTYLNALSQRAIPISYPGDIVVVDRPPGPMYLSYLDQLGFEIGELFPVNPFTTQSVEAGLLNNKDQLTHLRKCLQKRTSANYSLRPYIGSRMAESLASALHCDLFSATEPLAAQVRSKAWFREQARELGIAIPPGGIYIREDVIAAAKNICTDFKRAIVKAEASCGGAGIWMLINEDDFAVLSSALQEYDDSDVFIVETFFELVEAPNLQFEISANHIQFLGATNQIIRDKTKHIGNRSMAKQDGLAQMRKQSSIINTHLQALGYRGVVGIDFIVTVDGSLYMLEINARMNSSSYALGVVSRLKSLNFVNKVFSFHSSFHIPGMNSFSSLTEILGEENLLNDTTMAAGYMPLHSGLLHEGRLDLLILAESLSQLHPLEQRIMTARAEANG